MSAPEASSGKFFPAAAVPPLYAVTALYILAITASFYKSIYLFPAALAVCILTARRLRWMAVYALIFAAGYFYAGERIIKMTPPVNGAAVTLKGRVGGIPAGRKFTLNTASGSYGAYIGKDKNGKLKQNLPASLDRVSVSARLFVPGEKKNFSSIPWRRADEARGIKGTLIVSKIKLLERGRGFMRLVYRLRKYLEGKMASAFSPEDYAYLRGVIWGDKSGLDSEIINDFRRTGLMHLLAVSGLHIGLFASFLAVCVSFFTGVRKALLISVPFAFLYSLLCGASPSSVRAAVMFAFMAAGLYFGRRGSVGSGLFAAALAMLLADPSWLFTPGFKLSFLAVSGIIFFSPVISGILRRFLPGWLAEALAIGFSCQFFIMPVLNETFFRFSVITPFINVFVLPLAGGIVFSVFMFFVSSLASSAAVAAHFFIFLSKVFASSASLFIALLGVILKTASAVPFATASPGHFPLYVYLAFYAALAGAALRKRVLAAALLFLFAASVGFYFISQRSFRVYVPYFGAGDCVFFTNSGKWFQAGTASDIGGKLPGGYKRFLKYHGIKKIDGCFILSPSIYHLGAFDELMADGLVKKFYLRRGMSVTNDVQHIIYEASGKKILEEFAGRLKLGGLVFSLDGEAMKVEKGRSSAVYAFGKKTDLGRCGVFIGDIYDKCSFWIIPQLEKKEAVFTFGRKIRKKGV